MSITGVGFAATWGARDGVVRMMLGCEQGAVARGEGHSDFANLVAAL